MMKAGHLVVIGMVLTAGCSVLGQTAAQKPAGTHYSAAFISEGKLVVFPFEGTPHTIDLPATMGGATFSANGRAIYGIAQVAGDDRRRLIAVTIKPSHISSLPHSGEFNKINSLAVNLTGDRAVVSAMYIHDGTSDCGLFQLDMSDGRVERIVDNLGGSCDFLSSWNQLSFSADGARMVGSAGKGQLGVINLREHRVERLWPGAAAWWSPDGRWIAALSYSDKPEIELIRVSDFAVEQKFDGGSARLQWSPDSRYLLVVGSGLCGIGTGYFGTLQMLDVQTGQRMPISSSKCKVNFMTTGWVSDDVLK